MLFDSITRTELRSRNYSEPEFWYLNISARPAVVAIRAVLEEWFGSYPTEEQADLRSRFRSKLDRQHQAAFTELYFHELFSRMGYSPECHPSRTGISTHPDYLLKSNGTPIMYAEITLAGSPSASEESTESRSNQVFDIINSIDSPNFFIGMQLYGAPESSPPVRRLRHVLNEWLSSLDPDQVQSEYELSGVFPKINWKHEGWAIEFRAMPRSLQFRGTPARAIGTKMGEVVMLNTASDIRDAIDAKSSKYGSLDLPYLIALNVLTMHCDQQDISDALFGDRVIDVRFDVSGNISEQKDARVLNGAFFGKKGARRRHISGVIIVDKLVPWSMGARMPELYHNPCATRPLDSAAWLLPQHVPNAERRNYVFVYGKLAHELLQLPVPWPPADQKNNK